MNFNYNQEALVASEARRKERRNEDNSLIGAGVNMFKKISDNVDNTIQQNVDSMRALFDKFDNRMVGMKNKVNDAMKTTLEVEQMDVDFKVPKIAIPKMRSLGDIGRLVLPVTMVALLASCSWLDKDLDSGKLVENIETDSVSEIILDDVAQGVTVPSAAKGSNVLLPPLVSYGNSAGGEAVEILEEFSDLTLSEGNGPSQEVLEVLKNNVEPGVYEKVKNMNIGEWESVLKLFVDSDGEDAWSGFKNDKIWHPGEKFNITDEVALMEIFEDVLGSNAAAGAVVSHLDFGSAMEKFVQNKDGVVDHVSQAKNIFNNQSAKDLKNDNNKSQKVIQSGAPTKIDSSPKTQESAAPIANNKTNMLASMRSSLFVNVPIAGFQDNSDIVSGLVEKYGFEESQVSADDQAEILKRLVMEHSKGQDAVKFLEGLAALSPSAQKINAKIFIEKYNLVNVGVDDLVKYLLARSTNELVSEAVKGIGSVKSKEVKKSEVKTSNVSDTSADGVIEKSGEVVLELAQGEIDSYIKYLQTGDQMNVDIEGILGKVKDYKNLTLEKRRMVDSALRILIKDFDSNADQSKTDLYAEYTYLNSADLISGIQSGNSEEDSSVAGL